MKIATSIVSALSSIVLSAVVSAALYDCSKSDTYYEYRKAEYTLEPQNRVCVKISGKLKEGITESATLALKFKYNGESEEWGVPFYSDLAEKKVDPSFLLFQKDTKEITPCFFLPSKFGEIKPKSEITVTMRATMPDRVKEIFCVEGTITTL